LGNKGALTMAIENLTAALNGGAEVHFRLYYGY